MLQKTNSNSALQLFVAVILTFGIIGLMVMLGNGKLLAAVSGPISAPASPSVLPSATPISAPVTPTPSASVMPSPSASPSATPKPSVSPSASPSASPVVQTWKAEFFNNTNLKGKAAFVTYVQSINFNWGYGSPSSVISFNNFSGRFSSNRYFVGGKYRFTTSNDDGVKIYMDGRLIHSAWYNQSALLRTFEINIPTGNHSIKVEYYEKGGLASVLVNFTKI